MIVIASVMQFSGIYDNCLCSSSVFGGDAVGYLRFVDAVDIKGSTIYQFWIGGESVTAGYILFRFERSAVAGVVMAFTSALLYGSAIFVASPTV